MQLPRFIAIHGLAESGKTTTADFLVSNYGYVRVKMADTLKDMVRVLLRDAGCNRAEIERYVEGDLKTAPLPVFGGKTIRHVMQTLGTEWRDMILKTMWVNIAAKRIRRLLEAGHRVVVDDIRFPHEIEVLRELEPVLWVITRGYAHEHEGVDTHASECPLPLSYFEWVIRNDGTIGDLHQAIRSRLGTVNWTTRMWYRTRTRMRMGV